MKDIINVQVKGIFLNKVDLLKYISIVVLHNTSGTTWVICFIPNPKVSLKHVLIKVLRDIVLFIHNPSKKI